VESDPALSSRVLKCVNSAAYGLRHRVTNLQRAISMLGFKQVRNLAVTASVSKVFRDNEPIGTYRRPSLWRHMVSVAIAARMIATRCEIAAFEEAFLGGLLHDIGIILEDQYCHERFVNVMCALDPQRTLVQVENEIIGFDHTRLGAHFAAASGFPEEAEDAIRYHHSFAAYHGPHASIVACVDLANFLCTLMDISSVGMKLIKPTSAAMDQLKVSRSDLKVWAVDLGQEIDQNKVLFNL
jgi:putative nucleotidyltransferase with HDIG domain